ncbi:HAD family hydrolase, partial [Vibrio cholerae]|nr:HAD family hydrolase [Vibrio cholerae]
FDLDGTLICSKKRLYELFCDLSERRDITFSEYWDLKFAGKSNQNILRENFGFSDPVVESFLNDWMSLIESDCYLQMDTLISGVVGYLEKASQEHSLYICTARQSISQTKKQLSCFSILNFFENVFITEQKYTKYELLNSSGINFSKDDWMIGDTGHDVITGKKIGVKTCAVLSGFMSENGLLKYAPDMLVDDLTMLSI